MVHGFAPGGGADATARIAADGLSKLLGQNVLVESKPGAGTTLASAQAARAAPDGYTIRSQPRASRPPRLSTKSFRIVRSKISPASAC